MQLAVWISYDDKGQTCPLAYAQARDPGPVVEVNVLGVDVVLLEETLTDDDPALKDANRASNAAFPAMNDQFQFARQSR